MSHGDISGRAIANARSPQAFGVCDGCGEWYNRVNLRYQMEWGGDALINQRFLYCFRCLSKPQPQLKTIILPQDPVPVTDPRPEVPTLLQNLNGFTQSVGPQGTSVTTDGTGAKATFGEVILTELDPTQPFRTKAAVLASAATGWGMPRPALADMSTTIATASVAQRIMPDEPYRAYLLIYGPQNLFYAIAQNGAPVLNIPRSVFLGNSLYAPTPPAELGTVTAGTGGAILQNGFTVLETPAPRGSCWTGEIWVLGFVQGQEIWAWEGLSVDVVTYLGEVVTDSEGHIVTP